MQKIRNIAIIAHVDHGKTTLVDKMLLAGKLFREGQAEPDQFLDNNDLERERGITILAKNVSINYKGYKINIIDTPGHADFGGEVERVLNMADGCLLLVDAFEGPMPQTRFVLQKAIQLGLKPIVVINKVDKPNCRPEEVQEMVFDLMFSLDATEEQLDFPTIYGSAKQGWMSEDWKEPKEDITALLDAIIQYIPEPEVLEGSSQMLITSLDYSKYVGRIAVGRVHRGELREGQEIMLCKRDGSMVKSKIKEIDVFEGLGRTKVDAVQSGDICAIIGVEGFEIGETIADANDPEPLPTIAIDEPTMSMLFTINNSPFFGKDGKFVTSRHIYERLMKELDKNLALRVVPTDSADSWLVYGRGVLHLSVLIETMRREGYELQVGQPQVIIKEIDGQKYFFGEDGKMATGQFDVDGKTYFTQEDGTFRTGWQEINGQKLYYAENGEVTKNQIVEIEGAKYAFDENGNLIKNAEKDGYKIDENGVATEVTPSEETTPTQDTTTQSQTQALAQTTTQSAPAQSTTTTTQAPAQTSTPSAPANDYVAPTPSVNSSAIAAAALAQVGTTQDCTMLVTNALRAVGINFHGWPENYLSLGTITSSPVAGDIIVYSGHVAIYIGNGQAVHGGWNGSQTVVASVSCDKALIGYVHVG